MEAHRVHADNQMVCNFPVFVVLDQKFKYNQFLRCQLHAVLLRSFPFHLLEKRIGKRMG